MGIAARFKFPSAVAADVVGNVYVAGENVVRKITSDGVVTTLAGTAGVPGSTDGFGPAARFGRSSGPSHIALAVDRVGNVYAADRSNFTIRKISPAGDVTTLAGLAALQGNFDGLGSAARFNWPTRIAIDPAGNLLVAEGIIRKITPAGLVTTLAGGDAIGSFYWGAQSLAVDRNGIVYVASGYYSWWDGALGGYISKVTASQPVTLLAGHSDAFGSDDGVGSQARFSIPEGMTTDAAGNIFLADSENNSIRRITPEGVVTTFAGTSPGDNDGSRLTARFREPAGIAVDAVGNVYVANRYLHVELGGVAASIRRISSEGIVTTLAGSSRFGYQYATGAAASFNGVEGLAVDSSGNVFVADRLNGAVRKVAPSGEVLPVFVFDPRDATAPRRALADVPDVLDVAFDPAGNLYVACPHTLWKVAPDGAKVLLAGSDLGAANGVGTAAKFGYAWGIALDHEGNVLVADSGNHTIRRVSREGVVTTVAGEFWESGDADGPANVARFSSPRSIVVDSTGNLLVLELNGRLRKITDGVVTTLKTASAGFQDPSMPYLYPYGPAVYKRLALDRSDNVYISDGSSHTIVKAVPSYPKDPGSRLTNLSVRVNLRAQQPLVSELDVRGSKPLLVRAVGPGLQPFLPQTTVAANPWIALYDRDGALIAANENWSPTPALVEAFRAAGAFPLTDGSTDAALLQPLDAPTTAYMTATTNGVGLLEVFDLGPGNENRLIKFSARHRIGPGADETLMAGFTITPPATKTLLIRGLGPRLGVTPFRVSAPAPAVTLTVFDVSGRPWATNDGWRSILANTFVRVGAAQLEGGSKDAALLLSLPPGNYSVVLSGGNGASGEGMIEIFDVE